MKRLSLFAALVFLLALQACGQNPLLRTVGADFAPIRVGSQWSYRSPSGGTFSREILSFGQVQGRDAFSVAETTNALPPVTQLWSYQSGQLEQYDATLGWTLLRRLPYVSGNKWPLDTGNSLIQSIEAVEAFDTVTVPAGKFDACYRLKTTISNYDPVADVTSTTQSLVWAAPDVGDVRYASVDVSGTTTITLELSSYRIPR